MSYLVTYESTTVVLTYFIEIITNDLEYTSLTNTAFIFWVYDCIDVNVYM